jgi:hypothetical protein
MNRFLLRLLAAATLAGAPFSGSAQNLDLPPDPQAAMICLDGSPAASLLNQWFAQRTAAGFEGVHYDNRDGGHSDIKLETYQGLQRVPYPDDARQQKLHLGLPNTLLPPITIGNCSMASGVHRAGSLPRIFYTTPQGMRLLFAQYLSDNLHVYPEHRDHDPGTNGSPGYGDLYPANTPYLIISQGSSHSDRPFVHALIKTVGAFRPEVRHRLEERRLIAPTLQQILRSHYGPAGQPFDYLSGRSHPTVFEAGFLDETAMVQAAHDMEIETLPPLMHLSVIREDSATAGIDYFEPEHLRSETLFDTNSAIARIYRTRAGTRSITVSARQSIDINNHELTYHWALLRGDPERVRIRCSRDLGQAEITVAHHGRRAIHEGAPISSGRVDIGVFAHNGHHFSAPGFVTFFFLPNETRIYDTEERLLEIHYGTESQQYGLRPVTAEPWMHMLTKLHSREQPHPLAELLKGTCDQFTIDRLAAIHADLEASSNEMSALTHRIQARLSELDNAMDTASKRLKGLQESQADTTQLTRAEAELNRAQAARHAAQPEIDILEKDRNLLAHALEESLQSGEPGSNAATLFIEELIPEIIANPRFFVGNQAKIARLRADPGHDSPAIDSLLRELVAMNVLAKVAGSYQLTEDAHSLRPNDYHHLRRLHLVLATDALFPEIIERPKGHNYFDPRVTSDKRWRDIYQHDGNGEITGWRRIEHGRITRYDAMGRILAPIEEQNPQEVDYRIDISTGQLSATPRVEPTASPSPAPN